MHKRNKGGIAVQAIVMLFFILIIVGGLNALLSTQILAVHKIADRSDELLKLQDEARKIVALLSEDSTPESDSALELKNLNDKIAGLFEGATIESCSDNLNPYFARKNIFEKTDLKKWMASGQGIDQWQQWREDNFLAVTDGPWLKDFFDKEVIEKKFSYYGYINFNNTDEFVLRRIYSDAVGEEGSEAFHSRVQSLLLQGKILDREGLKTFLQLDYEKLYPMMNTESSWNVHFLDPETLREILRYPAYAIAEPDSKFSMIMTTRASGELAPALFVSFIDKPKDAPVFTYLGTKTWFYRIEIKKKFLNYRIIVMQLPPESDTMTEEKYRIVEERTFRETIEE
jgi:hypothetical protein